MSWCRKPARVARPRTVFVLSGGVLRMVFIPDTEEVTGSDPSIAHQY
jgi:hypothetical protein